MDGELVVNVGVEGGGARWFRGSMNRLNNSCHLGSYSEKKPNRESEDFSKRVYTMSSRWNGADCEVRWCIIGTQSKD